MNYKFPEEGNRRERTLLSLIIRMRNLTRKDFQVEDTSACTNDTFVSTLFVQKKEAAYKTKISIKKYIISRAETSILTNSARNERIHGIIRLIIKKIIPLENKHGRAGGKKGWLKNGRSRWNNQARGNKSEIERT